MDTDIQLISLNNEKFNRKPETNFTTPGLFDYIKQYNFQHYVKFTKFKKKRSVEETIKFLELQCFELVTSGIIKNIENESLKIKFLEEHFGDLITPTLEQQMNEIMDAEPPINIIVAPSSLTFIFNVPEPEINTMSYTTLETNTNITHVEGTTYV